jgi:mRNA interferase RelE/StbE
MAGPPYRLEFSAKAARQFTSLPLKVRNFLQARLEALAENPHPQAVTKLSEYESLFRLRAGDYRIFFEIQESDEVILIVRVGHRRDVYRK